MFTENSLPRGHGNAFAREEILIIIGCVDSITFIKEIYPGTDEQAILMVEYRHIHGSSMICY